MIQPYPTRQILRVLFDRLNGVPFDRIHDGYVPARVGGRRILNDQVTGNRPVRAIRVEVQALTSLGDVLRATVPASMDRPPSELLVQAIREIDTLEPESS